ncbi:hypothetical protein LAZ67_13000856 [Cordylochernes scorpioides]|uniref:ATP-dependent DNA helicase n=1 Tax=Cordylochernes scorpioides TaxID=51811 RepID=A0ABY6L3U1_9ARAC|nr:hypothetical protein LAZ67_13000856 [Cordylochernes scorpioides]
MALFSLMHPEELGKTFLINLLLAEVRSKNAIALAIASSGIAATLIAGGRTAHSMLKLPLNIANEQYPTCNISSTSGQAQVLKSCIIIVWDECTMAHKHSLEALDRTLRDLKGNNKLMGGILLLLAGDFRQTLPVIPRSTPADEINACLKASVLWKHIKNITLRTNLRVQVLGEHSAQNFARKLLQIGEGTFPNGSPMCDVSFPLDFGNIVSSVGELIDKVFPNIAENFRNHGWLCERTILAPRNDAVDEINNCIQDMLPGSVTEYNSINTMVDVDDTVNYPSEFLNSLNPSGLPPHHLRLKIGSPIMLLRNLDPPKLCNGTRLCVKRLLPNVIEATILTGKENGKDVLIPRIPLIPNDFPFLFKRLQFPVVRMTNVTIDNRYVVQYSPLLCRLFDAHINVESYASISAIKYICKYIYKGSDQSIFAVTGAQTESNEVLEYQRGRYISSNEAVWRILGFPIHRRHQMVQHLSVHLENGQRVYFNSANAALQAHRPPKTTLTELFALCQRDNFAKTLLYVEVPVYYIWSASKSWQPRKQGTRIADQVAFASDAIGRVYTVHPNFEECFYLRMLLHSVRGPTSFAALRTINGVLCQTYKEACLHLGLLENDQQWYHCILEAVLSASPLKIRELFAIVLTCCHPTNPQDIWAQFKEPMSADILILARQQANDGLSQLTYEMSNQALILLEQKVLQMTGFHLTKFGMRSPQRNVTHRTMFKRNIV